MLKLPGLIDVHVHVREPGATHKEDWDSGTKAALAGGFTTILAMPNTKPPITDAETFNLVRKVAQEKAHCDFGQFLGAGPKNFTSIKHLAPNAAGLKMYLDQTYGPLRLDEIPLWMEHISNWPRGFPIAVHAEGRTLVAVILIAVLFDRAIHLCHVSRRDEILVIKAAKEKGYKVTCEVTPHHLFLTEGDISHIGRGKSEVRPRLASKSDQDSLWENLDVIDCFATDHAPHTLDEKTGSNPPPGFPGLETALPLFLTAIQEGRLSFEDLITRMHTNPNRIFNLPEQSDTLIEIDPKSSYEIRSMDMFTRCDWTPFEGMLVNGRINRVIMRGQEVYRDGEILSTLGFGKNIRA